MVDLHILGLEQGELNHHEETVAILPLVVLLAVEPRVPEVVPPVGLVAEVVIPVVLVAVEPLVAEVLPLVVLAVLHLGHHVPVALDELPQHLVVHLIVQARQARQVMQVTHVQVCQVMEGYYRWTVRLWLLPSQ